MLVSRACVGFSIGNSAVNMNHSHGKNHCCGQDQCTPATKIPTWLVDNHTMTRSIASSQHRYQTGFGLPLDVTSSILKAGVVKAVEAISSRKEMI